MYAYIAYLSYEGLHESSYQHLITLWSAARAPFDIAPVHDRTNKMIHIWHILPPHVIVDSATTSIL